MEKILHKVEIERPIEEVYGALTQPAGLSNWWAPATSEDAAQSVTFAFGEEGDYQLKMKVERLVEDKEVVWKSMTGPWAETGVFTFGLESIERGTVVRFSHEGWPEADDFFMHCNSKWGFFLTVSLKNYLETGKGQPNPEDPAI